MFPDMNDIRPPPIIDLLHFCVSMKSLVQCNNIHGDADNIHSKYCSIEDLSQPLMNLRLTSERNNTDSLIKCQLPQTKVYLQFNHYTTSTASLTHAYVNIALYEHSVSNNIGKGYGISH